MKNFISPNSHPSSFFTGSTLESMVSKVKELETGYYTCTDHGHLTNVLKAYNYAKKKDIKLIAGCDIYFLDPDCDIVKNTKSKQIKYYTLTVHAKTQEAYQVLVKKISSKSRSTVTILEQEYPLFTWSDLEDFAKNNFTAVIGGPQDIVCKNLLVDEPVVAAKVFSKLKGMFGQNLYSSVIPLELDKKWVNQSIFTLADGQTVTLDSSILAETDYAQTFRVTLEEVANKPEKHKKIRRVYVNNIGYKVNKEIVSACNHKDFKDIGVDIYKKYNTFIKMMSERVGVPILINDYSYLAEDGDKLVQDLKLGEDVRFYSKNSIKTTQDVLPYLRTLFTDQEIETMIENSYKWASNFDNFKLKYDYRMVREHENTLAAAMDLIKKIGRFNSKNPEHLKRLKQEIDVIHFNGEIDLLPYFFPISKALNYYSDKGRVVGPARGSAGGSFLLYCMGITQINPLKYDLYFSRFLTLGRILKGTLPDVDCDFPNREMLVDDGGFLDTHYKDRWAQISTRSLMRLKSAIRDVNRFKKGKVEEEIEKLATSIEAAPQGISDNDFVFGYEDNEGTHVPGLLEKNENLKKYTEERPEEWEIVRKTLGIPRQNGRHASAFVISDVPIIDVVPLMKVSDTENVTQYEAKEVEAAGLIKYDFLVVKCLNDIELAIKHINKEHYYGAGNVGNIKTGHFFHKGNLIDIWDLPEEADVFNMLGEGKTETVFQLNTVSVTPYVQKIQPKTVEECAVVTSLVRPGPLDFIDEKTGRNMAEEYIERVNGRSKGDIQILNELLPETHGVFVFQEQITKLVKKMAGWDDEKAEDVRIAVGKKQLKMIMELKPQFIQASVLNGIEENTAKNVWAMIETFGRYGFNKSHAVAYAMIAYACAYLKYHYPLEWWAAVLSNADDKEIKEVLWPYVKDTVSPPDINMSNEEMIIDYRSGTIRNKLSILKGLGPKVANRITEGRPYADIHQFIRKEVVGASLARKLIHVGVMDSLFPKDSNLMEKMQIFEDACNEWDYRKKIFEKSEREISMNQPIEKFIEIAKKHPKTSRCKHEVKKGEIDLKYAWIDPVQDYILKKSIFPTMPMELTPIIKKESKSVRIFNTEAASYALSPYGREVRLVDGKILQNIKQIPHQPGSQQIVDFCIVGYVVEAKEFSYKNGEKTALKIILDIDGFTEEFVHWPDYDSGILQYPKDLKKESVIFLFMSRKMGKEQYHTNIGGIVVESV